MANKFKDFDAMFSEMTAETIPFRAYGKIYHIRKEIPAVIVLEMARMEDGAAISPKMIFKAAAGIFGEEVLSELCKKPGFSAKKLEKMVEWAFAAINGKADDDMQEMTEDDSGASKGKKLNLLAVWGYVEADFRRDYGICLTRELPHMSWREFKNLLDGLSPFGAVASHYEAELKKQQLQEQRTNGQGAAAASRFWNQITSIKAK